jgi:hypothetical protein
VFFELINMLILNKIQAQFSLEKRKKVVVLCVGSTLVSGTGNAQGNC